MFSGFGLPQLFGEAPAQGFERSFKCCSVAMAGKSNLENGDKIILPATALDELARMNVQYPMLFKITNPENGMETHVGVLEFSAEPGRCYVPHWIMSNLVLGENKLTTIKNVSLPKATFVKFQPQSADFLEMSDPKAVLERQLRSYSCLTQGDTLCFEYGSYDSLKKYYLKVLELKPARAVSIIETDTDVDFAPPPGYEEGLKKKAEAAAAAASASDPSSRRSSAASAGAGGMAGGDAGATAGAGAGAGAGSGGVALGGSVVGSETIPSTRPLTARERRLAAAEARMKKFGKTPSYTAFAGAGHTLSGGVVPGSGPASSSPAGATAGTAAGAGAKLSAGGVITSAGRPPSAGGRRPRTENRFAARRKSLVFQGAGKTLKD